MHQADSEKHIDTDAAETDGLGTLPAGADSVRDSDKDTNPSGVSLDDVLPEIDGYAVLEIIGRGGMGVVYKARDLQLGRYVAIKMVASGPIASEKTRARFEAEARAVATLQHPAIAQVYQAETLEGRPYFVMEFVGGGSLSQKIDGTPQPPKDAARLLKQLADAVAFSHRNGIVHRDLKPANVLLTADGQPKIADFGLVKWMDNDSGATKTGDILGTPSYMAPEQAGGVVKNIGPPCDIYALGAILYELLTGRPPFRTPEPLQTVMMVLSDDPVAPRVLQPTVPKDLQTICLKCLEKQPAKRYASAEDLAADLNRYLNNEPILARPVGRLERGIKWVRRRPAAAAVVALCLLGAVGGTAGAIYHSTQMEEERDNARRSQQDAEEERDRAKQERDRAERLFKSGHELSKALLNKHLYALAKLPGGTAQQEKLAAELVNYLDRLAKDAEDDTVLLADLANAYEDVARVQGNPYGNNRGAYSEALKNYRKALALRRRLAQERPDEVLPRLQLILCHKYMADIRFQQGKVVAVRKEYEEVLKSLEGLRKEFPKDNRILAAIIKVIGTLGDVDEWEANVAGAVKRHREALKRCEEFVPGDPAKEAVHEEIRIQEHTRIGQLLQKLNDVDGAREHFLKVFAVRKKQYENDRDNAESQADYADSLLMMSDIETRLGNFAKARKLLHEALPIRRYLAKADDTDSSQSKLATVLGRIGLTYLSEKNENPAQWAEQGIPYLQDALKIRKRLAEKTPDSIENQQNLGIVQRQLADAYARTQDYAAAVRIYHDALESAKRLEKLQPGSPAAVERRAMCLLSIATAEYGQAIHIATTRVGPALESTAKKDGPDKKQLQKEIEEMKKHFDQCFQHLSLCIETWKQYESKYKLDARTRSLRDTAIRLRDYLEKQRERLLNLITPRKKVM